MSENLTSELPRKRQTIGCYHQGCGLGCCYRDIDEVAAKKAYDAFAGPRGKRTTKEKMRDALAVYEAYRLRDKRSEYPVKEGS